MYFIIGFWGSRERKIRAGYLLSPSYQLKGEVNDVVRYIGGVKKQLIVNETKFIVDISGNINSEGKLNILDNRQTNKS